LNIDQKWVSLTRSALDRDSQNNMMYDPMKAKDVTNEEVKDCDEMFSLLKVPFKTGVDCKTFEEIMRK